MVPTKPLGPIISELISTFKFGYPRFDLEGGVLQGQTGIAKLKSAYNSLIIGPRGLGW